MRLFYSISAILAAALMANAAQVTDVISASTLQLPEAYEQQEATFNSEAVYLVTLKDEGSGPQCKAGSSGIATKTSGGTIARVEVSWGSKSNEDLQIYGQHTPYTASNAVITGTLLGTIEFAAGATVGLDIDPGEWEYIGVTTTAKKGKAAQFGSISFTWDTPEETPEEACEGIIISEVCGDDGTKDGHEDWVELYNPTSNTLDLSGVKIVKIDEDGVMETICTIGDGTTVAPDAYCVVEKGTHFTAGISNNKPVTITVVSPLDVRLAMFDKNSEFTHNGAHIVGGSYSRENNTGAWRVTDFATKGDANKIDVYDSANLFEYHLIKADELKDGMTAVIVNLEHSAAMSYYWNTTKDGAVYLCDSPITVDADGSNIMVPNFNHIAFVTLVDGGDGSWAIKFGDTNNYLNESKFMACTKFKSIDFKKKDDPAKGTRATITFNEAGDAEISFGDAGSLKYNYKNDGTSRFLNYDPTDKPEDHLAVYICAPGRAGVTAIDAFANDSCEVPVYYNMQGMRVDNPTPGLYIKRVGNNATKVIVR